jgi:hypothetical protein
MENDSNNSKKYLRNFIFLVLISLACIGVSLGFLVVVAMSWGESSSFNLLAIRAVFASAGVFCLALSWFIWACWGLHRKYLLRWAARIITPIIITLVISYVLFLAW